MQSALPALRTGNGRQPWQGPPRYADLSHLDREFTALAGCAPSIWHAEFSKHPSGSPPGDVTLESQPPMQEGAR